VVLFRSLTSGKSRAVPQIRPSPFELLLTLCSCAAENRPGPSNLGNVISQILLCKQITPDFRQEELCSITKDSQDVRRMVQDMQEFMPQQENNTGLMSLLALFLLFCPFFLTFFFLYIFRFYHFFYSYHFPSYSCCPSASCSFDVPFHTFVW
jgi:hypothetical protein